MMKNFIFFFLPLIILDSCGDPVTSFSVLWTCLLPALMFVLRLTIRLQTRERS